MFKEIKENDELSWVELQRILLARCNFAVSAQTISSQWNLNRRHSRILKRTRSCSERVPPPQRSISRSICVPVTHFLLGYFCLVLYIFSESLINEDYHTVFVERKKINALKWYYDQNFTP